MTEAEERARLRTLKLHRILDTGAEEALDALTALAAEICETPIALISLVDERRQWFKSRVGLEAQETPRDWAFCAHAIQGSAVFTVRDAAEDPRFSANPLVVGDPRIRFYAGAPLEVENGDRLGTLCVIDRVPRELDERQVRALKTLRRAVVSQLELRRKSSELNDLQSLLRVCAWCRAVQRDDGDWVELHRYVAETTRVSHGMCPDCAEAYER